MDKLVRELYLGDGMYPGVKFVFTIYTDNSLMLAYYNGRTRIEEPNVELLDVGDNGGKKIEYGTSAVRTSMPFKRFTDGKLHANWVQIK